jgi:hypothetical protein
MNDDVERKVTTPTLPLVLITGVLMVVCGVGAFMFALMLLMELGTKHHANYEHYGQTPAVALVFVAGGLGFLAPGVVVWYLRNRQLPWRFSLRTLLIVATIIAIALCAIVTLSR